MSFSNASARASHILENDLHVYIYYEKYLDKEEITTFSVCENIKLDYYNQIYQIQAH